MSAWRKIVIPLSIIVMFGSFAWAAEPKVWHRRREEASHHG